MFCHWASNHSYFSNAILVCIMVSSALLGAENPLRSETPTNRVCLTYPVKYCLKYCSYLKCSHLLSGAAIFRLLFYHSFYYRTCAEDCLSRVCASRRRVLPLRIQPSRLVSRLRVFSFRLLQVRPFCLALPSFPPFHTIRVTRYAVAPISPSGASKHVFQLPLAGSRPIPRFMALPSP